MIAWVSPCLTVRSTPRRISRGPASVSTETCRSRISRVAMWSGLLDSVDRDEDVVAVDLDGVDGDGLGGRQSGGPPGEQVETRAVQPALEGLVLDLALREGDVRVRAHVVDGVDLALAA